MAKSGVSISHRRLRVCVLSTIMATAPFTLVSKSASSRLTEKPKRGDVQWKNASPYLMDDSASTVMHHNFPCIGTPAKMTLGVVRDLMSATSSSQRYVSPPTGTLVNVPSLIFVITPDFSNRRLRQSHPGNTTARTAPTIQKRQMSKVNKASCHDRSLGGVGTKSNKDAVPMMTQCRGQLGYD